MSPKDDSLETDVEQPKKKTLGFVELRSTEDKLVEIRKAFFDGLKVEEISPYPGDSKTTNEPILGSSQNEA
jgi:hypothetical protein